MRRSELVDRPAVMLGGRVWRALVFGDVSAARRTISSVHHARSSDGLPVRHERSPRSVELRAAQSVGSRRQPSRPLPGRRAGDQRDDRRAEGLDPRPQRANATARQLLSRRREGLRRPHGRSSGGDARGRRSTGARRGARPRRGSYYAARRGGYDARPDTCAARGAGSPFSSVCEARPAARRARAARNWPGRPLSVHDATRSAASLRVGRSASASR